MEQAKKLFGEQQLEISADCAIIKEEILRKIDRLTDDQCREILELLGLERR